ncbi:hypothetical protein PR202_ga26150 [Eleusine coracana subsp. coracana]|uniref:Uncharacterized protein n=1 Tax=Eleusine coracana subsp. coracana TaxID=191504 RepID=A0AAV5DB53_ELECO|nr:hypothetical protein PR202_ga26150 [Eleusine coracana subsp. coracana]
MRHHILHLKERIFWMKHGSSPPMLYMNSHHLCIHFYIALWLKLWPFRYIGWPHDCKQDGSLDIMLGTLRQISQCFILPSLTSIVCRTYIDKN